MKRLIILILAVAVLGVAGCAIQPSQEELDTAYYGSYPDDYENIVKQQGVEVRFFDPESARYKFEEKPVKGWFVTGFMGSKKHFGYRGIVWINAKNRMGGYTGFQKCVYVIHDGNLIYFESAIN